MEDELISKKDLLDLTGISYGQLYRWKRKNLIPEEWFIRKSTFTGQETFFLKDKILERIDKIKNMKEDLSLDDLAHMFSPNLSDILLNKKELIGRNIVSQMTLDIYSNLHEDVEVFSFEKILYIAVLERFLQAGAASLEEGKIILQNLEDNYKNFSGKECEMVFIRKFGIATCLLVSIPNEMYFEKSTRLIERLNLSNLIEELKIKVFNDGGV